MFNKNILTNINISTRSIISHSMALREWMYRYGRMARCLLCSLYMKEKMKQIAHNLNLPLPFLWTPSHNFCIFLHDVCLAVARLKMLRAEAGVMFGEGMARKSCGRKIKRLPTNPLNLATWGTTPAPGGWPRTPGEGGASPRCVRWGATRDRAWPRLLPPRTCSRRRLLPGGGRGAWGGRACSRRRRLLG